MEQDKTDLIPNGQDAFKANDEEQAFQSREYSLKRLPGTLDAGLMYTIAALLYTYVGTRLGAFKLPSDVMIILSEVFLIALPPVLYVASRKYDLKQTFRLKCPRPLEVLVMLIISPVMIIAAICAGFIALVLVKLSFGSVLIGGDVSAMMQQGMLWSVFIIALIPAFCEEMLFRGLIQRGMERLGAGWSIFFSGMLFGLFHFDFQRLAAQTLIGFIAAYAVYRTGSIFNGMILHFANNALLTLISGLGGQGGPESAGTASYLDPFSIPEFAELAARYNMTLDQFLNSMLVVFAVILAISLFMIFGLLLMLKAITRKTHEKPVTLKGSGLGLLAGLPGLALILIVYTAIGLQLLKNPAGKELLRLLGI